LNENFDFSGAAASAIMCVSDSLKGGFMAFFAGTPLLVIVQLFLASVILLGVLSVTAWAVRRLGGGRQSPRLAVIDYANVDRRRRLILVRRDNVEHLVMIGGPTDIVVEANFGRRASAVPRAPLPPVEGATVNRLAPASRPTSTDRVEAALNALTALAR
jgi:flagellar biogenesis protein FliO